VNAVATRPIAGDALCERLNARTWLRISTRPFLSWLVARSSILLVTVNQRSSRTRMYKHPPNALGGSHDLLLPGNHRGVNDCPIRRGRDPSECSAGSLDPSPPPSVIFLPRGAPKGSRCPPRRTDRDHPFCCGSKMTSGPPDCLAPARARPRELVGRPSGNDTR
jgi:hypothetical protein